MGYAFKLLWAALKDAYFNIWKLFILNFLWFICSLPLITLPFTTAGLAYTVHQLIANGEDFEYRSFFKGMKRVGVTGLRWFLPNLLVMAILLFNLIFSFNSGHDWALPVFIGNVFLLFAWLIINTFTWPFLLEQQKQVMRQAIRNSAVIFMRRPFFTILLTLFLLLVFVLCIVLVIPFALIAVSFCLFMAIYALRQMLVDLGERSEAAVDEI